MAQTLILSVSSVAEEHSAGLDFLNKLWGGIATVNGDGVIQYAVTLNSKPFVGICVESDCRTWVDSCTVSGINITDATIQRLPIKARWIHNGGNVSNSNSWVLYILLAK